MEDVFNAYSQGYDDILETTGIDLVNSLRSIASVANKEFLHILRDRRILILILTLPPAFTLLFGHAFEVRN